MISINEEFKFEVGKRLKYLREQYHFTIDDLVSKLSTDYLLDVDEKTIRRYEKGDFLPKIDNLIIFSELYNVSLDYLIFGKETSDDSSYTFKDNFKRLNRLIYSLMLLPWKNEDKDSKNYGKYFFTGYDEELTIYLDKLINFMKTRNYGFEVRGKKLELNIHDLDNLTEEFSEYKEQLLPSKERINNVICNAGENPYEILRERIEIINKRRRV